MEENAETGNIFPVEIEKLLLTAEEERREEERREEKKKRKDCAVYLVLGQPLRGREPAGPRPRWTETTRTSRSTCRVSSRTSSMPRKRQAKAEGKVRSLIQKKKKH